MSRLRIRLAHVLVLLAVGLLAASCGGDGVSKDDYEREMRGVAKDITTASREVSDMKADAKPAERAATIRRQSEQLGAAADKAGKIDAPSDAKDAHSEFVKALRDYAKLLDRYATASEDETKPEEQAALLSEAREPIERLDKASQRLSTAGYTFQK